MTCLEGGGVPALCWRLLALTESGGAPKVTYSLSGDPAQEKRCAGSAAGRVNALAPPRHPYLKDGGIRAAAGGFQPPSRGNKTQKHRFQRSMAMALYQDWVVPVLIDLSMRNKRLRPYRERVAGAAEGRVLDVGIGSGLNLPFFGQRAREVFGLDPSSRLLARARDHTQHTQVHLHPARRLSRMYPAGRPQHG